jgi:hypothetical protein
MSCVCLSKYHGRTSRDALRAWSGWASTVIHGPRYEPDCGQRYEPGCGPRHASGRRTTSRFGPQGRATHPSAGPLYASGRRAVLPTRPPGREHLRTPDQLLRHREAGPSDQRTDYADTFSAAYDKRSKDELAGRTTGRSGYIGPTLLR